MITLCQHGVVVAHLGQSSFEEMKVCPSLCSFPSITSFYSVNLKRYSVDISICVFVSCVHHHHHWTAIEFHGCRLQVSLSYAVLCQIVSLPTVYILLLRLVYCYIDNVHSHHEWLLLILVTLTVGLQLYCHTVLTLYFLFRSLVRPRQPSTTSSCLKSCVCWRRGRLTSRTPQLWPPSRPRWTVWLPAS